MMNSAPLGWCVACCLCLGLLLDGGSTVDAAPPGTTGWTLVWSDEFNGPANAAPDTSKWGYGQLPWGGNYHNSSYTSVVQPPDSYLLLLTWPGAAAGFGLESTTNLGLPAAWIPAGQGSLSNGQFFITVPISNQTEFFRLHQP